MTLVVKRVVSLSPLKYACLRVCVENITPESTHHPHEMPTNAAPATKAPVKATTDHPAQAHTTATTTHATTDKPRTQPSPTKQPDAQQAKAAEPAKAPASSTTATVEVKK